MVPAIASPFRWDEDARTQAYLTMTPELLPEASKCFARYAAIDNTEENDNV